MNKIFERMAEANNQVELLNEFIAFVEETIEERDLAFKLANNAQEMLNNIYKENEDVDLAIKHVKYNYSVKVLLINKAIRFKVRDFFNKKGFKCSVIVEDRKTYLEITWDIDYKKVRQIEKDLEELKVWAVDYLKTLDNHSEEANLKDVKEGEFSYIELADEHRIIVKINYADKSMFRVQFKTAKWDAEFKAWRISNIKSNIVKLEELAKRLKRV